MHLRFALDSSDKNFWNIAAWVSKSDEYRNYAVLIKASKIHFRFSR